MAKTYAGRVDAAPMAVGHGLTTFSATKIYFTILCLLKSSLYFRITLSGHLRQLFCTTWPDYFSKAEYDPDPW